MKPTDIIEKSEKLRKAWFDKCLEQDISWQALLKKTNFPLPEGRKSEE